MEKNKKALQYHSIFIHWGCQWTYDGLKSYPSTPTWLNANMYRTACLYVRRASSTTWGLTTQRPFLVRVDREMWQSYISYALNANVAVFLWIPHNNMASTGCVPCWAMRTEHSGVFTGNHPLPIQLYQTETIIACKNNCSIKKSAKDNFVFFWQIWSPYTIFIKVHLSAISLKGNSCQ